MDNHSQIKDVPRFDLINTYENRFKDNYQKNLGVMIGRIATTLKSFITHKEPVENELKKAIETVKYAIGVVLNNKGQVLLGKSLQKDFRLDKYCFPGGTIEENDGIYETVEREVEEETGLTVESDNGRILVDGKCIFSVCKLISGEIKPNEEFESLDWYDLSDLPKDTLKQNHIVLKKILNRDQIEKAWNSELEKASKHGEGKHKEGIVVHKNGKTFIREQEVGSAKKEEWWGKFKQYKLSRYPVGIPESEVQTNTEGDVHSHWVMMWNDPKSKRTIRAYSHEFLERNAQVKWERIKNVSSDKIDTIKVKAESLLQNGTDKEKQCAAVVFIIASTGLRPGDKLRMADTGNRGVSTLGPNNVLISGKDIKLNFIGKSYKVNNAHIINKKLSDYLQERIKATEGKDTIFNVSKKDLMDTFRSKIGGTGLKLKDMRTYVATDMARKILFEDTLPPPPIPENTKELRKEIEKKLNVCYDKVSKQLNNTPVMAKNSYIHPAVVDAYLKSVGVTREQIMKANTIPTLDEIIANSDYKGKNWDIEDDDDDLDNLFNQN